MQEAMNILTGWKEVCKSHLEDFEEDKKILECENCELKDVCFSRKKPVLSTQEDLLNLISIIKKHSDKK